MSFVHLREYKRYIIYTTVFIGLILLINVFAINYIKEEQKYQDVLKLSAYQKVIQALIINNIDLLQKSSINNQYDTNQHILLLKDYIKNQVFVPKSSSDLNGYDNHLGYINLQELLNDMSDQMFKYLITVNDQKIVSHGIMNTNEAIIVEQYKITKDLLCNVSVQINPDSIYAKEIKEKIRKQILNLIINSCVIFSCAIILTYYFLNRDKKIKTKIEQLNLALYKATERNKNIILFKEKDKAFILKCYQYSKNILNKNLSKQPLTEFVNIENQNYNKEYLPLSLVLEEDQKSNFYKILLQPIIDELQEYFNGYVAYYNTKIILEIVNTIEKITVPFDKEIFTQIIFSLFCNILYFNKDLENSKYIKLAFKKRVITCSSNGFLLDHNLAIRYSEKIFNDTGNLYILSLGQIFALLKRYKLNYVVSVKGQETIIEIKFKNESIIKDKDESGEIKVISFAKFKKKENFT